VNLEEILRLAYIINPFNFSRREPGRERDLSSLVKRVQGLATRRPAAASIRAVHFYIPIVHSDPFDHGDLLAEPRLSK
jgi:hypothetical protein